MPYVKRVLKLLLDMTFDPRQWKCKVQDKELELYFSTSVYSSVCNLDEFQMPDEQCFLRVVLYPAPWLSGTWAELWNLAT